MSKLRLLPRLALATSCWLALGIANASIIVNIGDGRPTSWGDAVAAGNVVPANNLTWAADRFYSASTGGTQGASFAAIAPTLTPDLVVEDMNGTLRSSLVMTWNESSATAPDPLSIASWDYAFLGEPVSLASTGSRHSMIHFSLLPPTGVWDVSLELIDADGRSRGWFRPGLGTPDITDLWGLFWLDLTLGDQDDFLSFVEPGFDITRVVAIRFNEAGMRSAPFPLPPPGTTGLFWNAWDSVTVEVPEPSSLTLIALAAGLLGVGRRRASAH